VFERAVYLPELRFGYSALTEFGMKPQPTSLSPSSPRKSIDDRFITSAYVPGSFVTHGKMPPLPLGELLFDDFAFTTFFGLDATGFFTGAFFAGAFFAGAFFTGAFLGDALEPPENISTPDTRLAASLLCASAGVATRASVQLSASATKTRTERNMGASC